MNLVDKKFPQASFKTDNNELKSKEETTPEDKPFSLEVSQKMHAPISQIAFLLNDIKNNMGEQKYGKKVQDKIGELLFSLKEVNDYNQSLYRFNMIQKRKTIVQYIRLIDVILKLKKEVKLQHNITLNVHAVDQTIYTDPALLGRLIKELCYEFSQSHSYIHKLDLDLDITIIKYNYLQAEIKLSPETISRRVLDFENASAGVKSSSRSYMKKRGQINMEYLKVMAEKIYCSLRRKTTEGDLYSFQIEIPINGNSQESSFFE